MSINHYPEDVFPAMSEEQLNNRITALLKNKISPDREAGHLMRIAERNTKNEAIAIVDDFFAENLTPELIHNWYLEACKKVSRKSYNKRAQKTYSELSDEQKFLDRFIVNKIFDLLDDGNRKTKLPRSYNNETLRSEKL
jgi:hypothetical protein